MNIYIEEGYKNRREYLESLAFDFDVPVDAVFQLASLLGKNEDFDGLVTSIEDYSIQLSLSEEKQQYL